MYFVMRIWLESRNNNNKYKSFPEEIRETKKKKDKI